MSIKNALKNFVDSDQPGAIVLQGTWGLGKTYYWQNQIVKPFLANEKIVPSKKLYSYVSMFGVDSLADLKAAIFQISSETDEAVTEGYWERIKLKWRRSSKSWISHLANNVEIPYIGKNLAASYNALTFYLVKKRLICIDDIERRGQNLSLIDVLGLVSQLAEQRDCRVVVILNTDALKEDDIAVWEDNKEKTFIGEMTYAPSLAECIELGLRNTDDELWAPVARDRLTFLAVKNIRIILRFKRSIRLAMDSLKQVDLRQETIERIAEVLVFLTYAHSGKGENAPPLDMVIRTGYIDLAALGLKKDESTPEQKAWRDLIHSYGLNFNGAFDQSLLQLVRNGYPDDAQLAEGAQIFQSDTEIRAHREKWNAAWRLYHDTLEENQSELADAMITSWPKVSASEHAKNLESLSRLLRLVGRPEIASQFISQWILERSGDRIEELSPHEINRFDAIKDLEITNAISTVYRVNRPTPTLEDALRILAERGFDDDAIAKVAATSPDDLIQAFDASPGRHLRTTIQQLMKLGGNPSEPTWSAARENARQALRKIASRSPLSADRVRNMSGIDFSAEGEAAELT